MTATHQHGGSAPVALTPSKSTPAWKLLLTLALAGALSGWLVVSVYKLTLPAVQRHAAQQAYAAVHEVLKGPARWDTLYLVNNALTRTAPAKADLAEIPKAFVGYDTAGKRVGVAVTAAEPGFQELLTLMIGFDPASGTLIGFKVLDQKETPGLGDKIERDTAFGAQFGGRATPLVGVKGRPGKSPTEVQTITGATISSRAVIRIINNGVAKWRPLIDAWDRGGAR
jgi:electron transport complex protein RnfG